MNDIKFLNGLRYRSFSIVYMHTFGINGCNYKEFNSKFIVDDINPIDKQIFSVDKDDEKPVKRFKLPSFYVDITTNVKIDESEEEQEENKKPAYFYDSKISDVEQIVYKGWVAVELSMFFDRTATLSFRLMVSDEPDYKDEKGNPLAVVKNEEYITTDHLISLVALSMGAEHWNVKKESDKTPSNINLEPPVVKISKIAVDKDLNWLEDDKRLDSVEDESIKLLEDPESTAQTEFDIIFQRYKDVILKGQIPTKHKPLNFVYVDVWEDVNDSEYRIQDFKEESEIVDYIRDNCKAEMVGLMTLYPKEWPYRETNAFEEVCGNSIAIDTDDFVLLNPVMCVCFGTYARRGKGDPTDWAEIKKQRKEYHVSWPEYMLILEMVLAKKYSIAAAKHYLLDLLLEDSKSTGKANPHKTRDLIEANVQRSMDISQQLLKLDAVNYSKFMSHKIMFDRTIKRLEIEKDEHALKEIMDKVNESFSILLDMREMKQAGWLNLFLAVLSIASLGEILFADSQMPFMEKWGAAATLGEYISSIIQSVVFVIAIFGIIYVGCYLFGMMNFKKRK